MNTSTHQFKPHLTRPKRFISKSEEFYDFVRDLGYQPSKHLLHEHLEYLFQDDESNAVARKLMASLKLENGLTTSELERFEILKKQNVVLYGADLEEAVHRHQSVLQLHSRQHDKQQAQNQELQRALASQEVELHRLRELDSCLQKATDQQTELVSHKKAKVTEAVQTFVVAKARSSNINMRLLSDNMMLLEKVTLRLLQYQKDSIGLHRQNKSKTRYISQINGSAILSVEDRLFKKLAEILRNYAPSLILKEAGYKAEGDLLSVDNAKKIFQKYKENFDRVKHSIVYEKTNELLNSMLHAELRVLVTNFKALYLKSVPFDDYEYTNGITMRRPQRREMFNSITNQINGNNDVGAEAAFHRLRELIVFSVRKQFTTLTDIRSRSKRKLERFFTKIVSILKSQKVRLTLLRNLSRNESNLYGRLIKNFEDHFSLNSPLKKLTPGKRNRAPELTFEGQVLGFIFASFGASNSAETLSSPYKVKEICWKIEDAIESAVWRKVEEDQAAFTNHFKHTSKMAEVLHQVQDKSWARVSDRTTEVFRSSKHELNSLDEKLKKFKLSSSANLKNVKKTRKDNLRAMKNILSAIQ